MVPVLSQCCTSKDGHGGLKTTASVSQLSEDGTSRTHAIGFGSPSGDFWRTVEHEREARCTERNVRAIHARALERFDTIKQQALDHYAARKA